MKKLIVAISLACAFISVADDNNGTDVKPKRNPVLVKTGGYIERPGVKPGMISIVSVQKEVPESDLKDVAEKMIKHLHLKVPVMTREESCSVNDMERIMKESEADFSVFVIDDANTKQTLGVFPDQKYAFVNVAQLRADGGEGAFLKARTRKELTRAILFVAGGASSQGDNNIMGPMRGIRDLDKVTDDSIPIDVVARVYKYLPMVGCNTRTTVPYRTAVMEGWAPAPTNEYQKAIWDRINAKPTNPIKIKPGDKPKK